MNSTAVEITDPWESLKKFTAARIALGRVGNSIPLQQSLEFKLAHAHARDAVYSLLDVEGINSGLQHLGIPTLKLQSKAQNRQQYLQRPDLGRLPDEESLKTLEENEDASDICISIGDGLSANAINTNAVLLLNVLVPMLTSMKYKLSPICLLEQARVALADQIAHGFPAKLSLILIGERPGLSAMDSISAYITYHPKPGLTDEARNCVSNIRPGGLNFQLAAEKIVYLIQGAFALKLSGIALKDNAGLLNG